MYLVAYFNRNSFGLSTYFGQPEDVQIGNVVIMVPTHNRPPKPDQDDYRRLDPSTYDGEFF
jgi:hypothetical protein